MLSVLLPPLADLVSYEVGDRGRAGNVATVEDRGDQPLGAERGLLDLVEQEFALALNGSGLAHVLERKENLAPQGPEVHPPVRALGRGDGIRNGLPLTSELTTYELGGRLHVGGIESWSGAGKAGNLGGGQRGDGDGSNEEKKGDRTHRSVSDRLSLPALLHGGSGGFRRTGGEPSGDGGPILP